MRIGGKLDSFFEDSEFLDYEVLRPLSHIRGNWELSPGTDTLFEPEEDSFAVELSQLIEELETTDIPSRYHDNEDRLARYVQEKFDNEIEKIGNRWVGQDYRIILQDAGFFDINEQNLVQSAKGRIVAAINFGQEHYDDMEFGHRKMLAVILTLILYHRC
ncbi:hypothetical protein BTO03_24905 [Vibrio parahaemolyticus]|uniref:hypothetical protein n=2 Tax=Vibrio vulnificus TaxID=672 RepID=UPI000A38783B|nr:hypothetical protein [Vibrio vulnificus]MCU8466012.1 hypothetical protein [Vibrio vulnificus]OUJ52044.1 hypothetical protein BTO03_24905 [Vibrio parahaemolyticus]PAO52852.1 hypothetical protein BST57_22365 [Vibrio vulnificus]TOA31430.1 hypothetical protein CGK28_24060 [Vibrio parahaemolyticus]